MKYEYEDIEELAQMVTKCFIKIQPVEIREKEYVNTILVSGVVHNEIYFCNTIVEAPVDTTPEQYQSITRATYMTICDKIKAVNPKALIYKGVVHE